jgi:type IV pilus assembly protein PilM
MWAGLGLRAPVIGLDIGSSAIRAVVLSRAGRRWSIRRFGAVDLPAVPDGERAPGEWELSNAVHTLLESLGVGSCARVTAAIDSPAAIVKRLTFPAMSRRELRRAIRWEAQPHVPFDPEDAHVDCHVLAGESRQDRSSLDVLLVAARKSAIEARALLVRRAGRALAALDIEAFALVNAYGLNYPERSDHRTLLVHVSLPRAVVCLLARGELIFTRDLLVSGRDLAGEVRTTLEFHRASDPEATISRVVTSGEALTSDGVADSLEAALGVPVEVFDPFRRLIRRTPDDGPEAGDPSYAVAVGLAIHGNGGR